jgi:hypothetical protein
MSMSPDIDDREHDKFYETPTGETTVKVTNVAGFRLKAFNYFEVAYPSTTRETYTFYSDLGGTLQDTITINYTDATKNYITDARRT